MSYKFNKLTNEQFPWLWWETAVINHAADMKGLSRTRVYDITEKTTKPSCVYYSRLNIFGHSWRLLFPANNMFNFN
jgi:hypothetical protein